jgi:glycosyltransferase involved in cell wall biosynthesis
MHLLILGGSSDHLGGLEAFRDRSAEALGHRGGWRISRIATSTAYLSLRRLPVVFHGLAQLFRAGWSRPDCVWLHYVNLPDLAYLALAKLLGLRVMVTPHLGANWRSQSNPALRALSGWLLSFADRLALMSRTQELEINLPAGVPKSYIRNFLPKPILTAAVPNPIGANGAIQLIHSGRLSEGKGTFLFIEVCKRLRAANVPFFARITGGTDETTLARLHAMIADYHLADHVAVLGRVPDAELLDLLRGSDVLVHLSRIDSYPLIVLEAMACGTMPICMELAGARDMIETYGGHIVSAAGAVEQTTDFVMRQDLVAIRSMGQAAAKRVRADYNWDRCAEALDCALQTCLLGDHTIARHLVETG